MTTPNVADGIHLITHAHVNCYLVEDDDGLTLVDAGLPSMWSMLLEVLEEVLLPLHPPAVAAAPGENGGSRGTGRVRRQRNAAPAHRARPPGARAPNCCPHPGHTDGHCILHLPGRNAVLSGDALVALDPYTGKPGPQIVASAATKDTGQALASLQAIAATGAATALPGHGEPWTQGAEAAVNHAPGVGAH